MIINEGGINWCLYTDLTVHEDKTVTINRHFRLHKYDCNNHPESIDHPHYYHERIWKEGEGRIALEYFVPEIGWCKIRNSQYIFDYK